MKDKLILALVMSFVGNIIAWFHMNAQFRWEWAREWWWIILGGVPVSLLFYYGTRYSYEYFGEYWAIRPLGFGIATITFAIMTGWFLHEVPSQRIIVSLILACVILYINLSVHIK
jgi:1,4-dihydroxy-2-naphthoate octaprenyltransferase|tara:strand:+ start:225 stop:569 length:345 start_codon:yes stop_codon:yes gene_type:complete